jgi:DNA-binding IscR family transcriptional regulator
VEAEAGVPVIQSALYSQLHRLRTVDELRTLLGLPREVVWRGLRALIQAGAVCTGEPLGVFREMTFIRRDQVNSAQPAGSSNEESVDRAILDCIEAGRLYSAHAVAAQTDILVRSVKLSLRKLSTLGAVRCFVFDDGMYFYLTAAAPHARTAAAPAVKPVDVYAELGTVNMATLDAVEEAGEGITATDLGRRLEDVFRGSRNTAARIVTKLRRSGLVQLRDAGAAGTSLWEATDIGSDVMAIARGHDGPAVPASAPDIRYDVAPDENRSAYLRLAHWILDTMTAKNGTQRRRIPVNKRILARSLNITKPHLDRCFRLLAPAGVSIEGWDIVIGDAEALRAVIHDA